MNKGLESIERVPAYVDDQRERVIVFTEEEFLMEREAAEIQRILGQMYVPFKQMWLIKRVYDTVSDNGVSPASGAMSVYELGCIHGIRAERKRRTTQKIAAAN
jgi:hypothetical protein